MKLGLIHEADVSGGNQAFRHHVADQLIAAGHQVVGPWSLPLPRTAPPSANAREEYWYKPWKGVNIEIIRSNCLLLDSVGGVIYLGADAISAAAASAMTYAYARSTPIFIHRGDHYSIDRVEDPFDLNAEFLCEYSGGRIVTSVPGILAAVKMLEAARELLAAG